MTTLFANNADTQLASSVDAVQTVIAVLDASEFPAGVSPTDPIWVTLANSNNTLVEITKCTGVSGNNLTVVRGQDGSTARGHPAGTAVEARLVRAVFTELQGAIGTNTASIQSVNDDLVAHTGNVNNPHQTAFGDLLGVPLTFPPSPHTHPLTDITDAGSAAYRDVPAAGDAAAAEVVLGSDTRLSDARAPTAHTHVEADITDLAAYAAQENGFVDRAESTISFDNLTRTFTITPTGTDFTFWSNRTKFVKNAAENIVIPNTTGPWFVYYDGAGALTLTQIWDDVIITGFCFVASAYWDSILQEIVLLGDERHGSIMDSQTHIYLHHTRGAAYQEGMQPTDLVVDGNGDDASTAQIGVGSGVFWDEDIRFSLAQQVAPAALHIAYRDGSVGHWRKLPATAFIAATTGTGRGAYNEYTGTIWQLSEVPNGDFFLMHLFGTNDPNIPYILVMGQNQYTTIANARTGALVEINSLAYGDLPILEQVPIASFILQTSDSYTNAVASRIRSTDAGGEFIDWRGDFSGGSAGGSGFAVWGNISGDINNQADLIALLGTAQSLTTYEYSSTTVGQTVISGADDSSNVLSYTVGFAQVLYNGQMLSKNDFTETSSSIITLTDGIKDAGDVIQVLAFGTLEVADTYTQAQADANFQPKGHSPWTVGATLITTSGSSVALTGIPSWVTEVRLIFNQISMTTTGKMRVQMGTSGGYVSTGYVGQNSSGSTGTTWPGTSFALDEFSLAGTDRIGVATFTKDANNVWMVNSTINPRASAAAAYVATGWVDLAGTLDRIQITASVGTFDNGFITVLYR